MKFFKEKYLNLLIFKLRGCLESKRYAKSRDKFQVQGRAYQGWVIPVI